MELCIYSKNYEIDLNFKGMNGLVFIEDKKSGKEFTDIDDAFKYSCINNIPINKITYCYSDNEVQYFKKFDIK